MERLSFFCQTVQASAAPEAANTCMNELVHTRVDGLLMCGSWAGSGMTVHLCGVQGAVGAPAQQGEQDGGSERGLSRENESLEGLRARQSPGLSKHRKNSSRVVHTSYKPETV